MPTSQLFGELLLSERSLTQVDLNLALDKQSTTDKRLESVLLSEGFIDEQQLTIALNKHLRHELVELKTINPDPDVIAQVNEQTTRELTMIPLALVDDKLKVAFNDPSNESITELERLTKKNIVVRVAALSNIQTTINQIYRALSKIDQYIQRFEATNVDHLATSPVVNTSDAPIIQVVNLILTQAQRDRASDVHIEPQGDCLRIRFRIDKALHDIQNLPSTLTPTIVSRIKILTSMNIVERRRPQDGQFTVNLENHELDMRVATTSTV